MVRAKFFVESIQHSPIQTVEAYATVILRPVFGSYGDGDDEANKTWSKYTPSGQIQMAITNPAAIDEFEIGATYYVDLTRVSA